MWIERTINNKFKFVEQYIDPRTQKKRRVSITKDKNTTHTKKQAQQYLNDEIANRLQHINDGTVKPNITFEEALKEWEAAYKREIRKSSYTTYTKAIKPRLQSLFPNGQLVSKINAKQLIGIYEELLYIENLSNSYVQSIKSKVDQLLRYCYLHDYIANVPVNLKVKWKNNDDSKAEEKFLDDDEVKAVFNAMKRVHRPYRLALEFEYWTGARFGEVAVLRPVDFFQRKGIWYVYISGTLVYSGLNTEDYYREPMTKTPDGMREVALPKEAVKIYQELSKGKSKEDFLFTYHNHPVSPIMADQTLKKIKERLELKKKLTTHTFRHTYVSKLAEEGVPLQVIQGNVGHRDSAITAKVYLHVTENVKEKYDRLMSNR